MPKFKLNDKGSAVSYSPAEQEIFSLLKTTPRDSREISELRYGRKAPFNGRKIVIGTLMSLVRKTRANNEPFTISHTQRRGPHPMAFWIVAP